MHFKEVAKIITVQKLVERGAQTMETMINARVALDIKKGEKLRNPSIFIKLHNGMIGLRTYEEPKPIVEAAPAEEIAAPAVIEAAAEAAPEGAFVDFSAVRAAYHEKLAKMHFLSFERILENLFREMKIARYTVVNRRTDGGIDYAINFQLFENNVNMLVVVRRWPAARKMSARNFDEINAVMNTHKFNACAVLAFSGFEAEGVAHAKASVKQPLLLLESSHLCDLLMKYNIGIARKVVETYTIDEQYIGKIEEEVCQKVEQHKKRAAENGHGRSASSGHQGGHPNQKGGARRPSSGKHNPSQQFKRRNKEDDAIKNNEQGENRENNVPRDGHAGGDRDGRNQREPRDNRDGRDNRDNRDSGNKKNETAVISHRRAEAFIDNL